MDHRLHSDVGRRSGMTSTPIPGYAPPLLGVRVTDLVSGPMQAVSRHFLDRGAQVTRVHRPGVTASAGFGPVVGGVAHAPTGAIIHQFCQLALHGLTTWVAHFEQPVFA